MLHWQDNPIFLAILNNKFKMKRHVDKAFSFTIYKWRATVYRVTEIRILKYRLSHELHQLKHLIVHVVMASWIQWFWFYLLMFAWSKDVLYVHLFTYNTSKNHNLIQKSDMLQSYIWHFFYNNISIFLTNTIGDLLTHGHAINFLLT